MIAGAESTIAGAELSIWGGGGARAIPKVYKLTPMTYPLLNLMLTQVSR